MIESTTVATVPKYVELAPAAEPIVAGTAGALLRDYLGILAFHLDRSSADYSAKRIDAALAKLPGLQIQSTAQTTRDVDVMLEDASERFAEILGYEWRSVSRWPNLLSLTRPMIARLRGNDESSRADNSLKAALVVLQRPVNDAPTLGSEIISLVLRRHDPAGTCCSLSIILSRTAYTVVDDFTVQSFVADLREGGLIADLETTPGYVQIAVG